MKKVNNQIMGRDSRTCHICGISTNRTCQKFYYSRSKKEICEKYGMYIYVCYNHFNSLNMGYSFGSNPFITKMREELKGEFIKKYGEDLFNELFG